MRFAEKALHPAPPRVTITPIRLRFKDFESAVVPALLLSFATRAPKDNRKRRDKKDNSHRLFLGNGRAKTSRSSFHALFGTLKAQNLTIQALMEFSFLFICVFFW
jgi:hypothetical protein